MFLFAKLALRKYPKIAACEVLTITSIVFFLLDRPVHREKYCRPIEEVKSAL